MPHVLQVHRVHLPASAERAGALLEGLGSPNDRIWPAHRWPPMHVEGPLRVGVRGWHGPMAYVAEAYVPGVRVHFRFTAPTGFHGGHTFSVEPDGAGAVLEHRLEMRTSGLAAVAWALVLAPLHIAVVNDAAATAVRSLGGVRADRPWSVYVRVLRALMRLW